VSPPRDPIRKSVPKKKAKAKAKAKVANNDRKKKPADPEKIVKKKIGKSQRP